MSRRILACLMAAAAAAIIQFATAVQPAEANSARRALGVFGAAAVGAVIIGEIDRAQRQSRRPPPPARRSAQRPRQPQGEAAAPQRQADGQPARQRSADDTNSAPRSDPFAGATPVKNKAAD